MAQEQKQKEECSTCRFWRKTEGSGLENEGSCRLNPKPEGTFAGHWCGQWKSKAIDLARQLTESAFKRG